MLYSPHYKMKEPESFDYYDVEDFNFNIEIIDNMLYTLEQSGGGGGTNVVDVIVTLPVSGWDTTENVNTQTISVEGVTENSTIILGMSPTVTLQQMNEIIGARLNAISFTNGSITFKCLSYVPSMDVPISIAIFN